MISPLSAAQKPAPTGHGIWAEGILRTDVVISDGWLTLTWTFTSRDLLRTYGVTDTVSAEHRLYLGTNDSQALSSTERVNLYMIGQDESPPPSGGTTGPENGLASVEPLSHDQPGLRYPQWTHWQFCALWWCSYSPADPINYGFLCCYTFNALIQYIRDIKNWQPAGGCGFNQWIYDFSGYGWKGVDAMQRKGDCYGQSDHVRLYKMKNGKIVAGAHWEHWDWWRLNHVVDSFEDGERHFYDDLIGWGLGNSRDSYWLNNLVSSPYNNGWVSEQRGGGT